jgi:arylsulfatase A-like enzyme
MTRRVGGTVLGSAEVGPGRQVLDVGSGPGDLAAAAAALGADAAGMDVAPSMLAITGTSAEQTTFDGLDMHKVLLGQSDAARDVPVMWVRPPDRPGPKNAWPDLAIRDGKWKLLVHRDGSRAELFDIDADPNEKNNLADKQPDLTRRLADRVIAWDRSIPSR